MSTRELTRDEAVIFPSQVLQVQTNVYKLKADWNDTDVNLAIISPLQYFENNASKLNTSNPSQQIELCLE